MSKKILVVEDQEDNRRIVRDLLTSAGFQLLEAATGKEGVRMAEANKPDLVLMDIQMPEMDGYEATRQIKARMGHIPIIVITSYALSGDADKAMASGADAYVSKPFSPRDLLATIKRFLPQ
jgi:two-component system cell cycle response regulator DivK